jgi:hypothetical protein
MSEEKKQVVELTIEGKSFLEHSSGIGYRDTVRTPDKIVEALKRLHDGFGLSFRDIAELFPWRGIPPGSICSMYHGNIPKKWYPQLGIPEPVEVMPCPQCGVVHIGKCPKKGAKKKRKRTPGGWVNAKDPERAAEQIAKRAEYSLDDLIYCLQVIYWRPPK